MILSKECLLCQLPLTPNEISFTDARPFTLVSTLVFTTKPHSEQTDRQTHTHIYFNPLTKTEASVLAGDENVLFLENELGRTLSSQL